MTDTRLNVIVAVVVTALMFLLPNPWQYVLMAFLGFMALRQWYVQEYRPHRHARRRHLPPAPENPVATLVSYGKVRNITFHQMNLLHAKGMIEICHGCSRNRLLPVYHLASVTKEVDMDINAEWARADRVIAGKE